MMLAFNFSVDFELAWGDLQRAAQDDGFYRRVREGMQFCGTVVGMLTRSGIPSTWGVVGACSCQSLDEVAARAPEAFAAVKAQLDEITKRRPGYPSVLFCPQFMSTLSGTRGIEIGSHG